jgi:hypothetical protein
MVLWLTSSLMRLMEPLLIRIICREMDSPLPLFFVVKKGDEDVFLSS